MYHCDNLELMAILPDASIDVICIDPPYLYLKNQKLERPFDERLFFSECKRLLKDKGFIVMFGRGVSFYRWNCLLDELGMTFKEEIVWDKRMPASPLNPVLRVHETVSVFTEGKGGLNKVRIPFQEAFKYDPKKVSDNLNRCVSAFGNAKIFQDIQNYFNDGVLINDSGNIRGNNVTISSDMKSPNRSVNALRSLNEGAMEKTILSEARDHYSTIHPTQKPVRLLERLLALVIPDKPRNEILVADFFAGSMSTMQAVINMGMCGIACEIDEEYFNSGSERIVMSDPPQKTLFD